MIKITEQAVKKFDEIRQKDESMANAMLRVNFGGYGWGGPKLQLTLDELKNNDDVVIKLEGITIVYNSNLEAYVNGSVVDYSNNWLNPGFNINSSNSSSC